MDGLLIDSEPYWDKARSVMSAGVGVDWNTDDHRAVMGVSTKEWVDYMITRLDLDMAPEQVEAHIIDQIVRLYEQQIPFLPGALEAVALAENHFLTGLASGSPRSLIDTVIGADGMKGKFQAIFSGDQVNRGKPSPDIYLATAEKLGVQPKDCVCLEDSGNGILAGRNAGMKVIGVPDPRFPPPPDKLAEADTVLTSLSDLNLTTFHSLG